MARIAGVARTTVSRVLNETGYVSDESRERVQAVIKELDYRPSASARSLRSRNLTTINVVIADLVDPFCARVLTGAIAEAYTRKIVVAVSLAKTEIDDCQEAVPLTGSGAIYVASQTSSATRLAHHHSGPIVVVGEEPSRADISAIVSDTRSAAQKLALRTRRRGRGRIAVITTTRSGWVEQDYARCVVAALLQAGVPSEHIELVTTDRSSIGGYRAAARFLGVASDEVKQPTAFICSDDNVARGVTDFCRENSLHVPKDVLVTGLGFGQHSSWGVSATVALPAEHMGRLAIEEIHRRFELAHAPATVRPAPATLLNFR